MESQQINPYERITQAQMFGLFFYQYIKNGMEALNYINDFHITESLINDYNKTIQEYEGKEKLYNFKPPVEAELTPSVPDVRTMLYAVDTLQRTENISNTVADNLDKNNKVGILSKIYGKYVDYRKRFNGAFEQDYRVEAKPVIWDITRNHNDYMKNQLELGSRMEVFCDREFKKNGLDIGLYYDPTGQNNGESKEGIEIKHDMKSKETGNFFIMVAETHNKYKNPLVPSGILKDDNTNYWVIGTPVEYYVVRKNDLKQILSTLDPHNKGWQNGKRFVEAYNGVSVSKGYIIRREELKKIALTTDIGEFTKKYLNKEISYMSRTPYQNRVLNNVKNELLPHLKGKDADR